MILTDVTLSYGENIIASGINAELKSGEVVCLIGRNGAGKSTLIRHILRSYGTPREVAKDISVVLTDRIDVDGMTVRDLVAMGRSPYTGFFGKLSKMDEEIVNDALCMFSMQDYAEREVRTLSDGERQKVMICKAVAQQTPYIILDEPTAFLDYPSKVETMQLLLSLSKKENKGILISTHDLDIALRYCDKLWLMKDKTLNVLNPKEFSVDCL